MCEGQGKLTKATVVDHITPHRLGEALDSKDAAAIAEARQRFWDASNWQPLCKTCHDSHKQRLEKTGRIDGCNVDGLPADHNHHWYA